MSDNLSGKLIVLMGGSGFIGNYTAQALLARGARVRIASRNPERAFNLKPLADLGQLQFVRCDVANKNSLNRVMQGADAAINLVGTFDGDLKQIMGTSAGWMAEAARDAGASTFVHVSAIARDPDGLSGYASAKKAGEKAVLAAFPKATILRPSILFGSDDAFLSMFADLIARLPVLPVFGPDAQLQPVYVDDVAEAIAAVVSRPSKHGGKTYELGGPEVLTMMDINQRIARAQKRERSFVPVPDAASKLFAMMPLTPMSSDQWRLLSAGNVVAADALSFKQLGIEPKPLGLFLDKWMTRYRKHGRFEPRLSA
jgi:NADH dehydrogenase